MVCCMNEDQVPIFAAAKVRQVSQGRRTSPDSMSKESFDRKKITVETLIEIGRVKWTNDSAAELLAF